MQFLVIRKTGIIQKDEIFRIDRYNGGCQYDQSSSAVEKNTF